MKFTVCELFAGVGGFRLGLERQGWEVLWSNQWEPSTKVQHANDCYIAHFGKEGHENRDIAEITKELERKDSTIPDHTLLVGGFPCQDYSVATTKAKGIAGKKGVLWWEIKKILEIKRPPYVLLENVDRLLVSPSNQRGRDMGILLGCLRDLDYFVEWRVINAADYGFPQKRRRVFIFAFQKNTHYAECFSKIEPRKRIQKSGFFASEFPVEQEPESGLYSLTPFHEGIINLSENFDHKFHNAGFLSNDGLYTIKVNPVSEKIVSLKSILEKKVDEHFYINQADLERHKGWKYVKGAKKEERTAKNGHKYFYAEGAIPFPDNLDFPSRTILTGEGSKNPNRCTHLIRDPWNGRFRILTPIEVERLNGFKDNWTNTGMPLSKRYFCMGNALVVGLIERLGKRLKNIVSEFENGEMNKVISLQKKRR